MSMSFAKILGWDESKAIAAMRGADAPFLAGAKRRSWTAQTLLGLARATRANAARCVDPREAAVLGLEAAAHEAKSAVLGAEASSIMGETVASILGDDDKLGTWSIMGDDVVGVSPTAKKVAMEAAMASPLGLKIRAGRKVYKMAQKSPHVRAKTAHIAKKAKRGDAKSQQDLAAIKAGAVAEKTRKAAEHKRLAHLRADERSKRKRAHKARFTFLKFGQPTRIFGLRPKKVNATRLASATKMVRDSKSRNPSRRRKAQRDLKVLDAAAKAGNPHAKKAMKTVALAHKLDAKKSPAQKKQFHAALRTVRKAKAGDPTAKQQVAVYQAAANAGDPHAAAVVSDLKLASQTDKFIAGGPAPETTTPDIAPKPRLPVPASMKRPKDMPRATQNATAQAAATMGVPAAAAFSAIAMAKAGDPTAKAEMKAADAVYTRAKAGDPAAKAAIAQASQGYKSGNPVVASRAAALAAVVGIRKGGKVAAPKRAPARAPAIPEYATGERRGGGLVQFGPIAKSPFRNYFRGIRA
jgi:hypothetical protein